MRLGLGTVQFGLNYGVVNRYGRTEPFEVRRILEGAAETGISVLDTAALYGESESVLGDALRGSLYSSFRVVTKTVAFEKPALTREDSDLLERTLHESLRRLQRPSVYALLLHRCGDARASGSEWLFERMHSLRERGLLQKIGVSGYSPEEMDKLIESHEIDLVQVPFSVLDQRFQKSGCFERLKQRGIEVHTRSAFLQGTLVAEPDSLPSHFGPHLWRFQLFHRRCLLAGVTPLVAALQFVLAQKSVDFCIVGVCNIKEFAGVVQAAQADCPVLDFADVATTDEALVNPSRWPKLG